jgi:hypothetical protein
MGVNSEAFIGDYVTVKKKALEGHDRLKSCNRVRSSLQARHFHNFCSTIPLIFSTVLASPSPSCSNTRTHSSPQNYSKSTLWRVVEEERI